MHLGERGLRSDPALFPRLLQREVCLTNYVTFFYGPRTFGHCVENDGGRKKDEFRYGQRAITAPRRFLVQLLFVCTRKMNLARRGLGEVFSFARYLQLFARHCILARLGGSKELDDGGKVRIHSEYSRLILVSGVLQMRKMVEFDYH